MNIFQMHVSAKDVCLQISFGKNGNVFNGKNVDKHLQGGVWWSQWPCQFPVPLQEQVKERTIYFSSLFKDRVHDSRGTLGRLVTWHPQPGSRE